MKAAITLLLTLLLSITPVQANLLASHEYQPDHTLAIDIPESDIITHVGKEGVAPLFERFMEHYGQFIDPENPKQVDFEFVMGQSNHQISRELQYLFNLAMDEGQDLSAFEVFGLKVRDNGHIQFNHQASMIYLLPRALFSFLLIKELQSEIEIKLIQRGFKPEHIQKLRWYLNKYNLKFAHHKLNRHYVEYQDYISPAIVHAVNHKYALSPQYFHHTLLKSYYISQFETVKYWRNWGLSLLSQFKPQQQRILISYLFEHDDRGSVKSGFPLENILNRIEKDVKTGKWRQDIEAGLRTQSVEELLL